MVVLRILPRRLRRHLVLIGIGLAVLAAAAGPSLQGLTGGAPWTGPASVIDGDTIEIRGRRIRLDGIDAPEADQVCEREGRPWRCGAEATASLRARLRGRVVACQELGQDRYGRMLARCHAGGESINAWMVREGWATAYLRYSVAYLPEQIEAWWYRRGVWAGPLEAPEDHRRRR